IAALAHGEACDPVRVDTIEESARIGALHIDLSQRRDVTDANAIAHAQHFPHQRALPVPLACERKCLGPPPLAQIDEGCAPTLRPAMARRQPAGSELRATVRPRERADSTGV